MKGKREHVVFLEPLSRWRAGRRICRRETMAESRHELLDDRGASFSFILGGRRNSRGPNCSVRKRPRLQGLTDVAWAFHFLFVFLLCL